MRAVRYVKYGLVAPIIGLIVRHTPLLNRSDAPPEAINFAGGGDFQAVGDEIVDSLVARAGLCSTDRVLDVGSGIGRVATALSRRFPDLSYNGFDIVRYGIDWSRRRLSTYPTYTFHHVPVFNSFYNPNGKIAAAESRFPVGDASQDLIFATSVFTHLPAAVCRSYLQEMSRCLAPNGRVYLTTFLADRRSEKADFKFAHSSAEAWIESVTEPDLAVAFSRDFWAKAAGEAGLEIAQVHHGLWSPVGEGPKGPEYQDCMIIVRAADLTMTR